MKDMTKVIEQMVNETPILIMPQNEEEWRRFRIAEAKMHAVIDKKMFEDSKNWLGGTKVKADNEYGFKDVIK